MDKTLNNLLPYISYHKLNNKYSAYIPYISLNTNIQNIAGNTYLISEFLKLSTDRLDYSPSYTYCLTNTKFEIGIEGNDLDQIYKSIKDIQLRLKNNNCIVYDNFETLEIIKN
jgi:hypothetical protein